MYMPPRELTFGEKACGVAFNPDQNVHVALVKAMFATMVDELNTRREDAKTEGSPEKIRMYSTAITELQTAQMWAVKAITWQY